MELQSITFSLIDQSAGYESTPDRILLGDVEEFSSDVSIFLRGEDKAIDAKNVEVSIQPGSFQIQTVPLAAPPKFFHDLHALISGERLDDLDHKRREIIEKWQKIARQSREKAYKLIAPFLPSPIVISHETDFRADDADQWVDVERYVRGEVQDLGGVTRANAHIRLPDGSTLKVVTDRDTLRNDTVNRLYKMAMLRIKAEYNVLTRELRNAKLLEFVEYTSQIDEGELARLARRGAQAWKDVPDATAWVDELRGGGLQ